jgi:hypothetical protein
MFRALWKRSRLWSVAWLCLPAVISAACSNLLTSPSSNDSAPPPNRGSVHVSINPNPVPYSGTPVTDTPECSDLKHTWFYDQIFEETAGVGVTFTGRVDSFDGFVVNDLSGLSIVVPARGTLTLHARWCSGNPTDHTARSTFTGVDDRGGAVSVTTTTIQLRKP